MDASVATPSHPRLWPRNQPLPDDEECLVIYEYLDHKGEIPAYVFPDVSQAAKNQIFRDYLVTKLETVTDNYNRGKDKRDRLSTQSVRTRQNRWHLPTKPGEKVEFVKSISRGLRKFRANGLFEPLDGMDPQSASSVSADQPPETDSQSTTTDFETPDTWFIEPVEPPALYLSPCPARNTSETRWGHSLPESPSKYPQRMYGDNSSLGPKLHRPTSGDELFGHGSVCTDTDRRDSKVSLQSNQTNDSGYESKHKSLEPIVSFNKVPVAPIGQRLSFQPDEDVLMTENSVPYQLSTDSLLQGASPEHSQVEEEADIKVLSHDPRSGLWYGRLQTLPCDEFHSNLPWMNRVCTTCGFSKAHNLPTRGHRIDAHMYEDKFREMKDEIFNARGLNSPLLRDRAGNTPVHFAAAAGLTCEHFNCMVSIFGDEIFTANVWGQNLFHVLNPVHMCDKLSTILEWFEGKRPGFIYERDVFGKTVLQSLLRQSLSPKVMKEVLLVFSRGPGGISYQLQVLDSFGIGASWIADNLGKYKIISETANDIVRNRQAAGEYNHVQFSRDFLHNIVSRDQTSPACPSCGHIDYDSDHRLHQIECAISAGAGENDYNENGLTPLQVLVSTLRHEISELPEACAITLRLVKKLLSSSASPRKLLHARSREGKTALYMAAERGQALVVEHLLNADPERKRAMANVRAHNDVSVLFATNEAFRAASRSNPDMMAAYRDVHILLKDAGGIFVSSDAAEWAL